MTSDRNGRLVAGACALVVHLAVIGGVWGAGALGGEIGKHGDERKLAPIEAGLMARAKNQKGRKTKQPQKDVEQKVAPPDAVKIGGDPDTMPAARADAGPPPKREDEIDFEAIAKKHREGSTGTPDPASDTPGGDDETKAGHAGGSDYGTLDENRGDPYLGELAGRLKEHFVVPGTVPEGQNLKLYGCARLNPDGSIAEVFLDEDRKSGNAALNSAALRSLKQASGMESPVPSHLVRMLVEQGACVNFDY